MVKVFSDSYYSEDKSLRELHEDLKDYFENLEPEVLKDSRFKSATESFVNIAVGFPINYGANLAVLPFYASGFGTIEDSLSSAFQIGILFTVISIGRSYFLRRVFNHFGANENGYTLTVRLLKRIKKGLLQ